MSEETKKAVELNHLQIVKDYIDQTQSSNINGAITELTSDLLTGNLVPATAVDAVTVNGVKITNPNSDGSSYLIDNQSMIVRYDLHVSDNINAPLYVYHSCESEKTPAHVCEFKVPIKKTNADNLSKVSRIEMIFKTEHSAWTTNTYRKFTVDGTDVWKLTSDGTAYNTSNTGASLNYQHFTDVIVPIKSVNASSDDPSIIFETPRVFKVTKDESLGTTSISTHLATDLIIAYIYGYTV